MMGGTIYVGGEIESLGKNAKVKELEAQELDELRELLTSYGFQLEEAQYQKFRKIVPWSKEPFYGKETEEG
jgi:glutamate synthase domain-containing protein 3